MIFRGWRVQLTDVHGPAVASIFEAVGYQAIKANWAGIPEEQSGR